MPHATDIPAPATTKTDCLAVHSDRPMLFTVGGRDPIAADIVIGEVLLVHKRT